MTIVKAWSKQIYIVSLYIYNFSWFLHLKLTPRFQTIDIIFKDPNIDFPLFPVHFSKTYFFCFLLSFTDLQLKL